MVGVGLGDIAMKEKIAASSLKESILKKRTGNQRETYFQKIPSSPGHMNMGEIRVILLQSSPEIFFSFLQDVVSCIW